jgi:CrcB protein
MATRITGIHENISAILLSALERAGDGVRRYPPFLGLMTPTSNHPRWEFFMDANLFSPSLFVLLSLGGLLGTFARYGLQLALQSRPGAFPWGTLTVNVIGCLVFGFLVRYLAGGDLSTIRLRIALTVGFCGTFTTMSSFSYATLTLLETGRYAEGAAYLSVSIGGSLVAMAGGLLLAQALR